MAEHLKILEDGAVRDRLISLINHMSSAQRRDLLNMIEEGPHSLRRLHPRSACHLTVGYTTGDQVYEDIIKNISRGGAFIETRTPFSVGEKLAMTFSASRDAEPVKISGSIVWTGSLGVGVRFDGPKQDIEALIRLL